MPGIWYWGNFQEYFVSYCFKAADLKDYIMYKAYEENHSGDDIAP